MIKKSLKKSITDFKFISERIISLRIEIYGYNVTVFGVYAPVDSEGNAIKDEFYKLLTFELQNVKTSKDIIIAGDPNARVKKHNGNGTIGQFTEEVENDNDTRLLEFCSEFSLKITNTLFAHKDTHGKDHL